MRKPGTTRYRLIDWMLVLALMLAPLQGAWSSFDSCCQHQHEHAMPAAQLDGPGHAGTSSSATAGDCCCHTQDNAGDHCAGGCQPVPDVLYLPSLKLALGVEFFTAFETQQPIFNNGRTASPPHQPPRS